MRYQDLKTMYAGLFVVLLMFAVSCDGVVDNQQFDNSNPSTPVVSSFGELSNIVGEPQTGDLLAGQHYKVGTVSVTTEEDTRICVTYTLNQDALDEGWGIYETHLAIGEELGDLPINNGGNPMPGRFPYGDDELDGVDEWTYCVDFVDLDVECGYEVLIAAHAVVKRQVAGEAIDAIIYGVGTTYTNINNKVVNRGDIYVIDPLANEVDIIFNDVWTESGVEQGPSWYPNALAFDEDNGRLYFSLSEESLFFYNVETEAVVNADPGDYFDNVENVLGATFADGYYWYILNQSRTLYQLAVDGNGIITGVAGEYTIDSPEVLSQGDIVYKDGVIYGSSGTGASGGANFKGFFSYDIAENEFKVLKTDPDYRALQLAWGLDGDGNIVLFGHQVHDGNWYTVDPSTGIQTPVMDGLEIFTTDRLEDLASGFIYEEIWESETAWGFGERFTERGNWATYFKFTLCEDEE